MSRYWKIQETPSGEYVARMEDVLEVYCRQYDPDYPVICMDESCKQLVGEVREPIPMRAGAIRRIDDEYVRKGVAEIFLAVEPLTGWRHAKVTERRTKNDWAQFIKELVDKKFPKAKRIALVMDNLNTHSIGSLYDTFPPEEARRIAEKLEIHFTPKHASWLNVAEICFSSLKTQCLPLRVGSIEKLREMIRIYVNTKNEEAVKVNWQFRAEDARIKLRRLYPIL